MTASGRRRARTPRRIDAINAFYRSPVGQKAVREMPAVVEESMAIGARLSQDELPRILEQVQRRLAEEGLLPP